MTQSIDDLEAVRNVVKALEGFERKDQERIIRWALEKLGHASNLQQIPATPIQPPGVSQQISAELGSSSQLVDIKTFIDSKQPKSENQLAATVAYYYKFVASPNERKDSINKDIIQEACRLAGVNRLKNPDQTLRNAHGDGLLDRDDKGIFSINAVGENLVAMTLPGTPSQNMRVRNKKKAEQKKIARVAKH